MRSLANIFLFPRKTYTFSRKDISVPSQNLHVLSQRYLCSLAKLIRSLAKIFVFPRKTYTFSRKDICIPSHANIAVEFGQTLPVYFTAWSSSVCSQWSGSYHFILNLDTNKEICQCLVQGVVLGHYKTLNVAQFFKTVTLRTKFDNTKRCEYECNALHISFFSTIKCLR